MTSAIPPFKKDANWLINKRHNVSNSDIEAFVEKVAVLLADKENTPLNEQAAREAAYLILFGI